MDAGEGRSSPAPSGKGRSSSPAASGTSGSSSVEPSAAPSPAPAPERPESAPPPPSIEEQLSRLKPCKVLLRDCMMNGRDDNEDDDDEDNHETVNNGVADDGYEDSSETPPIPKGGAILPSAAPALDNSDDMLKAPSSGVAKQKPKESHTSIYSTSFKQFTLRCCFAPCKSTAESIRDITDHFKVEHNLSAAAMVWDKPMDPGQTEPEWQKRFEVIITHGEKESLELAKGGFKKSEEKKKGKAQFQCSRCDVQQQQTKSMIRHIEEHHCGFKRYTCGLCAHQTHAVHLQLEHWNKAHAAAIGTKESLVIYSRHLTLSELSADEFEEYRRKRPENSSASSSSKTNSSSSITNGVVDVKPEMNRLKGSLSTTSVDSGVVDGGAEPEITQPPPTKRARTNSQKQSTPTLKQQPHVVAAAATFMPPPSSQLQSLPATATPTMILATPPTTAKTEMATEPGEYELLMPVRIRVSDDKIRYITFGVPRSGDKVKDQIIQLRQLDTPMVLHQNCFPAPPSGVASSLAVAAPSIAAVGAAAKPRVMASANANVVSMPNYIATATGNHLIVRPPIAAADHGRLSSPSTASNIIIPAGAASRHGAPKILTIPQAPPFPVNAGVGGGAAPGTTHFVPLTSVAASSNGVHNNATLISNPIAISGLTNGVAMISPHQQLQQQSPSPATNYQLPTVTVPAKQPPQQKQQQQKQQTVMKPQQQQQHQASPTAQRVEVGDGGGNSMAAVATVLTRFKCNQCEAVYNNRDSIVAHIYTHMKVRPFKCALCNSIAAMSKTILKHLTKEHGTNDSSLILEQRIPNESSYYSAIQ